MSSEFSSRFPTEAAALQALASELPENERRRLQDRMVEIISDAAGDQKPRWVLAYQRSQVRYNPDPHTGLLLEAADNSGEAPSGVSAAEGKTMPKKQLRTVKAAPDGKLISYNDAAKLFRALKEGQPFTVKIREDGRRVVILGKKKLG